MSLLEGGGGGGGGCVKLIALCERSVTKNLAQALTFEAKAYLAEKELNINDKFLRQMPFVNLRKNEIFDSNKVLLPGH